MLNLPKIAVASCRNLPDWEIDDAPFLKLLNKCSCVEVLAWDCPTTDWSTFDVVLIRTTWDYSERIEEFLQWARQVDGATRLIHSSKWLEWNSSKVYLRDLAALGAPLAPTWWLSDSEQGLSEIVGSSGSKDWFIKPTVGASSSNTLRFHRDSLHTAVNFMASASPQRSFIVQPYLSSVETYGEVSLIFFDGVFSHSVRKVPLPGDYRVQDDYGASDEPYEPSTCLVTLSKEILNMARAINSDVEELLYARLDYLKTDTGQFVLNELEVIEPSLFFRHAPDAPSRLASALFKRLQADK